MAACANGVTQSTDTLHPQVPFPQVLDVGCGIGGSAFYMARCFGALVHGIDLSVNMIALAQENRANLAEKEPGVKHRVQFHVEDATTMSYPQDFYDVVYSRDTILHIEDKAALFRKFFRTLKGSEIRKVKYGKL